MKKSTDVRRSMLAGSWYPGSRQSLLDAIDGYLAGAGQPVSLGKIVGLISPHAGYAYSGQTAAYAYRQLDGQEVDTVVLMGPSHRAWVGDFAASAEDAYETPLGEIPLDRPFIQELNTRVPLKALRRDAEHCLEIQLPFLQRQLKEFHLVPILMSADNPAAVKVLASALADILYQRSEQGQRTLLVASSDLHHIENYDHVVRRDQLVVEAIAACDLKTLTTLFMDPKCSVCGRMPILTLLQASKAMGADKVTVLHHTNSGDVTGQRAPGQYTVGYMAAAIQKSQ